MTLTFLVVESPRHTMLSLVDLASMLFELLSPLFIRSRSAWMDDVLLGIIGAGCGALATGVAGGAYCATVTSTVKQVLDASPDVDLGSAYSCAKIGTGCDAVSSD